MDRVTSGRMAPDMTIFEAVVLAEAETKYFDLRKDIVSKRDEMLRKLKRLGISKPVQPCTALCEGCTPCAQVQTCES